jgi:hypothetical protein
MGTGSYVDPSLHWYRSTLAHNAPLVGGRSQARVHGSLRAHEETPAGGWVDAHVEEIAAGVHVSRALVAMPDYLVDLVEWESERPIVFDLPLHLDAEMTGSAEWTVMDPGGAGGLEDGFDFVRDAQSAPAVADSIAHWTASRDGRVVSVWASVPAQHEWWRAVAPGAPGRPPARFYWSRARGTAGAVRTVIDWAGAVRDVRVSGQTIVVERADGGTDSHSRRAAGWAVERRAGDRTTALHLGGAAPIAAPAEEPDPEEPEGALTRAVDLLVRGVVASPRRPDRKRIPVLSPRDDHPLVGALEIPLGEAHYRRSEQSWQEAGSPTAVIRLGGTAESVIVEADVAKPDGGIFAPARERNELDNEHPDVNSDGVQLYLAAPDDPVGAGWLLVPEAPGGEVRVTRIAGAIDALPIACRWAPTPRGYRLRCELPLADGMRRTGVELDVIVNEIAAGRERRRGQLVLSGGDGEWVYLRGDRQPRGRYLPFAIADDGR